MNMGKRKSISVQECLSIQQYINSISTQRTYSNAKDCLQLSWKTQGHPLNLHFSCANNYLLSFSLSRIILRSIETTDSPVLRQDRRDKEKAYYQQTIMETEIILEGAVELTRICSLV